MPDEIVVAGSFDQMREHIAQQIERIASENEIRRQLLQEELDRRFLTERELRSDLKDLLDERADNAANANRLLQEEIDRRLANLTKLLDERYATQTKAIDAAFVVAEKAVENALTAQKEAVAKAETANERRFDAVNEFRAQQQDIISGFMSRNEYNTAHQNLVDVVNQLRTDLTQVSGTVVPRNENESWRTQINDKINDGTKALAERIGNLELRLTSRLDLGAGRDTGENAARADTRELENLSYTRRMAGASSATRANIAATFGGIAVLISAILLIVTLTTKHGLSRRA